MVFNVFFRFFHTMPFPLAPSEDGSEKAFIITEYEEIVDRISVDAEDRA